MRGLGSALVVITVLGSLTGCRNSGGSTSAAEPLPVVATPRAGGRIVYGVEADPNGLDPTRNAFDPSGLQIANALYDPAAAFDESGRPQPYLLKAIEPSNGFTRWRIALRPGIRFHDGSVLDVDALKLFVEAIRGSAITGEAARYIDRVTSDDAESITIWMKRPWATFPSLLTGQGGYIISPRQVRDDLGHSQPAGTGPFKLASWERGSKISLVRNEAYWRAGLPYLDAVDFTFLPDGDERVNGLRDGTVDVTSVSALGDINALAQVVERTKDSAAEPVVAERDASAAEVEEIMFNTAQPPFDNVHARRALAHATDVRGIARANGWNEGSIADGPFPIDSPWHAKVDLPRHDPDRARQEVATYERETGKKLRFELMASYDEHVLQQMLEQWRGVGIEASINMVGITETVPRAVAGWYQAIQFRYFSAVDPDVLWHFWTSETIKPVGGLSLNFTRLQDPAIDRALEDGRATDDLATRKRAYRAVQERFAELVPYLWLARAEWVVARRSRVHDARNVTLPDGSPAMPLVSGTHRLTETWVEGR